ncbi:CAP-Gly domain-containing linker protein 1-like isoform X2 [Daphnia pulex]|uniref:CAP-Gly domain-containing linker protein 1-like isoform X2 n=1 Tax=Daphnia pulex TaxID=6669 RepID=UPI001EDD683B|nr:CAP-Gly domain-containing linker protein 1-like isoform X2 [Daphnia pulex]
MVTTQMRCILVTVLVAVCCNCQSDNPGGSSSWEKLQISPDPLSSMEYGNFLVEIYEHANNHKPTTTASEKKYFYSPLALLDHKSAFVTYNKFTKQTEMRFRIEMWNDKVQNEVVKHLNEMQMDGHEIKSNKVRVIPLEKVILVSKRPTMDYSLSPEWTNYDKSKILWLSLSCYDQKICDELANEMRSVPKHADHFKLLYSLSSQTSQTKQTTISIDSVTSGQMVSTLLQKFGDKKEIFLTANDEKKMLAETVTSIRMDTFDDYEVLSPDTESQILSILKDLLVTSRTTIKEQRDKMWDSVFWIEDNYRPDKTTKTLNEIINKLDKETQKKLSDMFKTRENEERIQHNFDSNSWADVDRISSVISGKMANDSDSSRRVEILKEDVEKLLQESRNHVEWDGERFVPKPMQLSRINLAKFRDSQSFQDRNLRVRYTSAELSAPIKFVEHAELTVTGEWNNLKDEFQATTELLNITVNNLVKINAELSHVKNNLTNKLEGTKKELEKTKITLEETRSNLSTQLNETKQELLKTRPDFLKTFDDLSTKLNATSKELAELKTMARNLSTEFEMTKKELGKTKIDLEETRTNVKNLSTQLNELAELKTKTGNFSTEFDKTKKELGKTKIDLEETRTNVKNLSTQLNATKKELAETKITAGNFSTELKETKQDLLKTRADLTKKDDDLSIKLKATEKELAGLKTTTGNFSTEFDRTKKDLGKTKIDLEETKSNVKNLSTQLNATEKQLAETKITAGNLSTELKETKQDLLKTRTDLTNKDDDLSTKIKEHELKVAEENLSTVKEIFYVLGITTNLSTTRTVVGQMPTSCADLERNGQKVNGFFLVKGSKKMETVYCNFYPNQTAKQKWIGYADVKSAPVHFYVQRNSSFDTKDTPLPFDLVRVNEGNAMNLITGKFTAPQPGTYFFSFAAVVRLSSSSTFVDFYSHLYLNGNPIGSSKVYEHKSPGDQWNPLTLQSTLNLKKGDQLWVQNWYRDDSASTLYDGGNRYTHFTGFLLEEEIFDSL